MNNAKVDFFVVGAARSGTTSIYNYLSLHPQVFLPKVKECNFFSNVESIDYEVYKTPDLNKYYHMKIIKSYEVYQSLFKNANSNAIKGEVSPSYLWDKDSAKNIFEYNPNAKIIISLRNPIVRAFSHYLMHLNTGHEKKQSFEEALKADKIKIWGGGNLYLEMGLYYEQVKAYFNYFDSKSIKILIYEDWILNTEKYMNEVYDFLNINAFNNFDLDIKHNETLRLKNRGFINFFRQKKIKYILNEVLSEETREKIKHDFFKDDKEKEKIKADTNKELRQYYKSDIKELESLIQVPLLSKWKLNYDQ